MAEQKASESPPTKLPAVTAGLTVVAIFIAVLSIPLGIASEIELTAGETTAWIIGLFGVPGVAGLLLAWRYRQPLGMTGNIFVILFIASLGTQLAWPELVGAAIVAGAVVLLLGPLGLTDRLSLWIPSSIVFGLLAAAILPFAVDTFIELREEPAIVGTVLVVFLLGRRFLEPRIPALLPALVAGIIAVAVTGEFGSVSGVGSYATPTLTTPDFSLQAILTVMPVMVILMTVQANIPSMIFLRDQGYDPPEGSVNVVSGAGTMAGSLLGPIGVSLSLPATALSAGPDGGVKELRHWAVYIMEAGAIGIALLAGLATQLAGFLPSSLLVAVVGVAVIGLLEQSLIEITKGPLRWGPLFAFLIALSGVVIFGFGAFFWAIVGGLAVSLLLEWDEWKSLQTQSLP